MDNDRNITIAGIFSQGVNIDNSLVNGDGCTATAYSHAEGLSAKSDGAYSHADGCRPNASDDRSYVWSGASTVEHKSSNGTGTFSLYTDSISPLVESVYIDGQTFFQQISSDFSPSFSNDSLLSSNNIFSGVNEFDAVTANGGVNINGNSLQSELSGIATATTVATSYISIPNRLATVGYVKNMMGWSTDVNNSRYVHDDTQGTSIGTDVQPIYVNNNGNATPSISSVGSHEQPVFLDKGEIVPLSASVGTSIGPIYLSNGFANTCDYNIPDITAIPRIVATHSITFSIHIDGDGSGESYDLPVRKWYRLYSDGWCEQGGTIPFKDFDRQIPSGDATYEKYATIKETVPYENNAYSIMISQWDSTDNVYNDISAYTKNRLIDSFDIAIGYFGGTSTPGHMFYYGGCNWVAKGKVSNNTLFHILNGDEWNHTTGSWDSELIFTTEEECSTTMMLTAGQYRLYMVGRGGHTYNNYVGKRSDCLDGYSGGAGATFILDFVIDVDTLLTFGITNSECILRQTVDNDGNNTDTALVRVGFGQNTTGGKVDSSNISMATFNYSIIGSYDGGASNVYQAWRQWDGLNGYILPIVKSEYFILYSRYNGCSSTAQYRSSPGAVYEVVAPGNPLIELYRKMF